MVRVGWGAVVAVSWGLVHAEARACSCLPGSDLVAPAGPEHPAGAPVVFESYCGSDLGAWSVTVDGEPAMLVGPVSDYGFGDASIEPTPPQGAEVVLTRDLDEVVFVIGAPDTVAPAAADEIVLEQEIGEFAHDCGSEEEPALQLSSAATFSDPETGTWAVVTFFVDGEAVYSEERKILEMGALQSVFYGEAEADEDREACVEVVVRDASGNASAVQRDCTEVPAGPSSAGCSFTPNARDPLVLLFAAAFVRRRRR